jgi:hypothetical protein
MLSISYNLPSTKRFKVLSFFSQKNGPSMNIMDGKNKSIDNFFKLDASRRKIFFDKMVALAMLPQGKGNNIWGVRDKVTLRSNFL